MLCSSCSKARTTRPGPPPRVIEIRELIERRWSTGLVKRIDLGISQGIHSGTFDLHLVDAGHRELLVVGPGCRPPSTVKALRNEDRSCSPTMRLLCWTNQMASVMVTAEGRRLVARAGRCTMGWRSDGRPSKHPIPPSFRHGWPNRQLPAWSPNTEPSPSASSSSVVWTTLLTTRRPRCRPTSNFRHSRHGDPRSSPTSLGRASGWRATCTQVAERSSSPPAHRDRQGKMKMPLYHAGRRADRNRCRAAGAHRTEPGPCVHGRPRVVAAAHVHGDGRCRQPRGPADAEVDGGPGCCEPGRARSDSHPDEEPDARTIPGEGEDRTD